MLRAAGLSDWAQLVWPESGRLTHKQTERRVRPAAGESAGVRRGTQRNLLWYLTWFTGVSSSVNLSDNSLESSVGGQILLIWWDQRSLCCHEETFSSVWERDSNISHVSGEMISSRAPESHWQFMWLIGLQSHSSELLKPFCVLFSLWMNLLNSYDVSWWRKNTCFVSSSGLFMLLISELILVLHLMSGDFWLLQINHFTAFHSNCTHTPPP